MIEPVLQSACLSLGIFSIGLIALELRTSLDRSFLYFALVVLLLCIFSGADLWGLAHNSSLKLIVLQHIVISFIPPLCLKYLTMLTRESKKLHCINWLVVYAVGITILFLLGFMFQNSNCEVRPTGVYYIAFLPYLVFSVGAVLRWVWIKTQDKATREHKLLKIHFIGFLFLALCGLADMIQLIKGPVFGKSIPSFTILGCLGLGGVITFVFTERLIILIRERLMFIDKLQGAYKDLEQARSLSEIGKSTAIINHEIKNYTCVISGYAQYLLMTENLIDKSKDMLNKIIETATKLTEFSCEILNFSKAKILSDKKPISIGSLIKKCVEVNFSGKQKVFWFVGFEDEPTIHGDWRKLEQVFVNLFKNALEAGAQTVTIKLLLSESILLVTVEDDGVGCTALESQKLFEAFHTTKDTGTGLGLVTSRSIVESHGGAMTVVSRNLLGNGSHGLTFNLAFPIFGVEHEDEKDPIVFIKDGVDNLSQVIAVFRNVHVNPHVIDSVDEIKTIPAHDVPLVVVSSAHTTAELVGMRAPYQCYSLVTSPDGFIRVVGSPPDICESIFSEEFVLAHVSATRV